MDVFPLNMYATTVMLACLRSSFVIHGLPETIVTDIIVTNGACFTWNVWTRPACIAPYHPASNGLSGCAIHTFKAGIARMSEGATETCISRFLFRYRITHRAQQGNPQPSPREANDPNLTWIICIQISVEEYMRNKQKQAQNHDQHALDRDIQVAQNVFVLNFGRDVKFVLTMDAWCVDTDHITSFQSTPKDTE